MGRPGDPPQLKGQPCCHGKETLGQDMQSPGELCRFHLAKTQLLPFGLSVPLFSSSPSAYRNDFTQQILPRPPIAFVRTRVSATNRGTEPKTNER